MAFKGFVFDVDGVLVDSPHERAWRDTLAQLMATEWADLRESSRWRPGAFTSEVYQRHISGRVREEGARDVLGYFGIEDPGGARTARFCELKQELMLRLIGAGEFEAFADAIGFLQAAKAAGGLLAAASSSKNANAMLSAVHVDGAASLLEQFDVNVCGRDFRPGKPHPGIFLVAIDGLGLAPAECLVVEDASSGVAAAKAAGAACLGVARLANAESLRQAGADWVVASPACVTVTPSSDGVVVSLPEGIRSS